MRKQEKERKACKKVNRRVRICKEMLIMLSAYKQLQVKKSYSRVVIS